MAPVFNKGIPLGRKPSVLSHAVSGTLGSLLAECVLFPIDTVKLRVQTATAGDNAGAVATAVRIMREHGIVGLYGGLVGAMIKESVHSMNFWLWHGFLFRYLAKFDDTTKTPPISRLLLNMLAKQLNWLCTVPFEAVSSINQLTEGSPGFFHTAVNMYRTDGVGAFFRSLPISLLLAINPAIMNTLITSILRLVTAYRQWSGEDYLESREHGAATVGAVTGMSKAVATLLTYPLIRAKVLQQTTSGPAQSILQVLRSVVTTEGVLGLYRGLLVLSYKTVLWNSLMMGFKHILVPSRAVTPPATPTLQSLQPLMPLMAREPFPVEVLTVEKLDEILHCLRMGPDLPTQRRIEKLEDRLDEATCEIREVRILMAQLVAAHRPAAAPARAAIEEPAVVLSR